MSTYWDAIYREKASDQRSWTQATPTESLAFIDASGLTSDAAIIDVGGGSARLVDELIRRGFHDLSVLDLSTVALEESRQRLALAHPSATVHWIAADVLTWAPSTTYELWHDRAVFHFLTTDVDQSAYVRQVTRATRRGAHLILATFSPNGPDACSGLAVTRWSADELGERFGDDFTVLDAYESTHETPWASTQAFTWAHFIRR